MTSPHSAIEAYGQMGAMVDTSFSAVIASSQLFKLLKQNVGLQGDARTKLDNDLA